MKSKLNLSDIHDAAFEEKIAQLAIGDIKNLVKKKNLFVKTVCPACLSNQKTLAYDLFGLKYNRCQKCRTVYLSPCPETELIFWYLNHSRSLKLWREKMPQKTLRSRKSILYKARVDFIEQQINQFKVPSKVFLDGGGGNGEIVEEIARRKKFEKVILIEPQPLKLATKKIEIVPTMVENASIDTKADCIVAFEVIEHIPDPSVFLVKLRDLLSRDGILILSTPNFDGFETSVLGTLSRAAWFDHIRLYNTKSITTLLKRAGFKVLKVETSGELDVEIVHQNYLEKKLDFGSNPALKFLMEDGYKYRAEFQNYLKKNNLSSSMRCVAKCS